jgi:hypothetical protein
MGGTGVLRRGKARLRIGELAEGSEQLVRIRRRLHAPALPAAGQRHAEESNRRSAEIRRPNQRTNE